MGKDDNSSFDGYKSDTESPGFYLLLFTFIYCILCLAIVLRRPNKSAELVAKDEQDDLTANTRRGLRGKKRFGGNFWKLSAEKKLLQRSRVQISQELGQKHNENKSIEVTDTEDGDSTVITTSAIPDENISDLQFANFIPLWDNLSDTRENEKHRKKRTRGFRLGFNPAGLFSNRSHAKSVSVGKKREKKPLVTSNDKNEPLLACDNSNKEHISSTILSSKNKLVYSLEAASDESTEESTKESADESAIENEMQEVFKLAAP